MHAAAIAERAVDDRLAQFLRCRPGPEFLRIGIEPADRRRQPDRTADIGEALMRRLESRERIAAEMRLEIALDVRIGVARMDEVGLAALLPALDHDVALDPMARIDEPGRVLLAAEESVEARDHLFERTRDGVAIRRHQIIRSGAPPS